MVRRVIILTRFDLFRLWVETGPFVVVCVVGGGFGLSFLFVAPFFLLAVFSFASAFNQNMSSWNTGAVTTMYQSKCTRSLSFSMATAPSVVACC